MYGKTEKHDRRPIAVFDSGVGGISVLSELATLMPQESFLYYGDSANAPYGSRTAAEVCALTDTHVGALVQKGAKAVVIACNTATGAAITYLRQKYAGIPVIGIEPAIKPAAEAFPGGRVLVLATPMTLSSEKFRALMEKHAQTAEIVPVPCPRLARLIESGILSGAPLTDYLTELMLPYRDRPADAVVLGCTHYPFIRDAVEAVTGTAQIFDGGLGTARETRHQLQLHGMLTDASEPGFIEIDNSDPTPQRLQFCERLLQIGREKCHERAETK
ncbi:MAG: glutamate racemase [Clostridia bacterium]|nr:glutamate racemase [Clostridia bacterium]